MLARDALLNTVVNNTGVIEARTLEDRGGEIKLLGSSDGGTVNVGGTLDASGLNGGNGGNIETSGDHVKVADDATITTKASHGQSGTWLIDPPDFTIAASGGDITGAALGTNLDNGNVTILSSQGTVNANGSGDINVNDTVSWNSGTTLTLSAVRNVNVNAVVANGTPGNGSTITLRADSGGACVAGTAVCGTVNFDTTNGAYVQADTVNIYYNPVGSNNAAGANGSGPAYTAPTDYGADVIGTVSGTANTYMLVNDAVAGDQRDRHDPDFATRLARILMLRQPAVATGYVINDSNGGDNYTVNTVANSGAVINPANLTVSTGWNDFRHDQHSPGCTRRQDWQRQPGDLCDRQLCSRECGNHQDSHAFGFHVDGCF